MESINIQSEGDKEEGETFDVNETDFDVPLCVKDESG